MSNRQPPSSYNPSPEAPFNNSAYSDDDYQIAEFEDMNDNDVIYVRWSVPISRRTCTRILIGLTQWVHELDNQKNN